MRRRRDLLFLWIKEEPSQPIILAGVSKVEMPLMALASVYHVYREPKVR